MNDQEKNKNTQAARPADNPQGKIKGRPVELLSAELDVHREDPGYDPYNHPAAVTSSKAARKR